jgi:hypothetical protein
VTFTFEWLSCSLLVSDPPIPGSPMTLEFGARWLSTAMMLLCWWDGLWFCDHRISMCYHETMVLSRESIDWVSALIFHWIERPGLICSCCFDDEWSIGKRSV